MKSYTNEELKQLSKQELIEFIWQIQNKLWEAGREIIELEKTKNYYLKKINEV